MKARAFRQVGRASRLPIQGASLPGVRAAGWEVMGTRRQDAGAPRILHSVFRIPYAALATLCWIAVPRSLHACAACFGQSNDSMAQGMNMGIFTLLLVIGTVLVGIASFGIFLARRSTRLALGASQPATSSPKSENLSLSPPPPTP